MIVARDLWRSYDLTSHVFRGRRRQIDAVRGVTLQVDRGEVFGLLGPNGAGKTTLIKMLITTLLPTAGSASILGYDVQRDARAIRRRIGFLFGGDRGFYDRLSAVDNLRYFADLYAVPRRDRDVRLAALLDMVGLTGREGERVEGYSRGMRQRLHIARSLVHDPDLVFFDEPTIGLDPVAARDLRATISSLGAAGKTVFLTTHYMFEADALCDRIAVLRHGETISQGTPASLKSGVADSVVLEIETDGVTPEVVERVRSVPGVALVTLRHDKLDQVLAVRTQAGVEVGSVLHALGAAPVRRLWTREPTLEDAYVALITANGDTASL